MKLISLIPVVAVGGLLLFAAKDFPEWGDPASPASTSPVSSHFIQSTGVDTEVPNMVTAVLADYRGFDTMFETVVVFIAGMAVLAILKGSGRRRSGKREHEVEAEPDLIVTNTVRLIVPVIHTPLRTPRYVISATKASTSLLVMNVSDAQKERGAPPTVVRPRSY